MNFAEKKRSSHDKIGVAGRMNCEVTGSSRPVIYAVGIKICSKTMPLRESTNTANSVRKTQTAEFHIVNSCFDSLSSVFRGSIDKSSRLSAATTCTTSGVRSAFGDVGKLAGSGSRRSRNDRMKGAAIILGKDACGTPEADVDRGRDISGTV